MKGLERKMKALGVDIAKEAKNAVHESALKIEADAKVLIQRGARTGHVYGHHISSAPGEAPKTDTGNLVSNITSNVQGLRADIGSRAQAMYGAYLEFGTTTISPRPWLRPTVEKNREFVKNSFKNNLLKAVRRKHV